MVKYKNVYPNELENFIDVSNAECINCVEGCLIDNLLYATDKYLILAEETYQNCWTSVYTVYLAKTENDKKILCKRFDELEEDDNE